MATVSAPVLLVEDDPDSRAMLAMALEIEGFDVVTAANGLEALAVARSRRPWAIVLDLMMPIMAGEQFRHAQLETAALRDIPVIVVSAHNNAAAIARRLNASAFLPKPIDVESLGRQLRTVARPPNGQANA